MNPILFLGLVIILSAALPWWPYSITLFCFDPNMVRRLR